MEEIHHIEFIKNYDMIVFDIHGGAESNTAIEVTSVVKNGPADRAGLRVRAYKLIEGVVYNIIIIGW